MHAFYESKNRYFTITTDNGCIAVNTLPYIILVKIIGQSGIAQGPYLAWTLGHRCVMRQKKTPQRLHQRDRQQS